MIDLIIKELGFSALELNLAYEIINFNNLSQNNLVSNRAKLNKFIRENNTIINFNTDKIVYLLNILNGDNKILSILDALNKHNINLKNSSYCYSDIYNSIGFISKHFAYVNTHFTNMTANIKTIKSNRDLPLSKITEIPELAEISGIENDTFSIYNSDRYEDNSRYLRVIRKGARVQLVPNRLPVIKYGDDLRVQGVAELKENEHSDFGDKSYTLYINHCFVKILPSFVVCVSTKLPQTHLGLFDIVCKTGSRIYVYGAEWSSNNRYIRKANTEYYSNTARIIDYGYTNKQLEDKLYSVAVKINQLYGGLHKGLLKNYVYVCPDVEFDQNKRISLDSIANKTYDNLGDSFEFS